MANTQPTVTIFWQIDLHASCLRFTEEARNCWLHLPKETWQLIAAYNAHPVNCYAHLAERIGNLFAPLPHKTIQLSAGRGAYPVDCCAHLAEESGHLFTGISHKTFNCWPLLPVKTKQLLASHCRAKSGNCSPHLPESAVLRALANSCNNSIGDLWSL